MEAGREVMQVDPYNGIRGAVIGEADVAPTPVVLPPRVRLGDARGVIMRRGISCPAPVLMIRFQCPECGAQGTADAYKGVAVCGACDGRGRVVSMEAKEIL